MPEPELLVRANGAAMLVAGAALALGCWSRLAAMMLAGMLVPTTLVGHAFWQETTPAGRAGQRIQFLKNLGLFGGLLLVAAGRKGRPMPRSPRPDRDLLEANQAVVLATNGPDGFPQVSAVWFLVDDGTIRLSLNTSRQKVKNLQRRPEATLFFFPGPANPYRTLEIRALATLTPDPDYAFADRLGAKYGARATAERPAGRIARRRVVHSGQDQHLRLTRRTARRGPGRRRAS